MPELELVVFSTGNGDNSKRSAKFYIMYSTTICFADSSATLQLAPPRAGPVSAMCQISEEKIEQLKLAVAICSL